MTRLGPSVTSNKLQIQSFLDYSIYLMTSYLFESFMLFGGASIAFQMFLFAYDALWSADIGFVVLLRHYLSESHLSLFNHVYSAGLITSAFSIGS